MHTRTLMTIALSAGVIACGGPTRLAPAPGAQPAPPGVGEGAIATSEGVQLEARVDAWRGEPQTLERQITPIQIEITNNSSHPLLVRYPSFMLTAANGETYEAMPPFDIEETVTQRTTVTAFPYTGFSIAPYLSPYYPGVVIADPFLLDRAFYTRMVPIFRQVQLPTGDMIQKALPEGVLAPGGKIAGFIYFEDVDDDVTGVTLSADLVDAKTDARFGQISIPFVTR